MIVVNFLLLYVLNHFLILKLLIKILIYQFNRQLIIDFNFMPDINKYLNRSQY